MTPDDLDRLEALAAAADAGPIGRVRFDTAVEQGDTALCLSPSVVSELIAAARLGAAWQAAEAALPEGWAVTSLYLASTEPAWTAVAGNNDASDPIFTMRDGPTPAAALTALRDALRERP